MHKVRGARRLLVSLLLVMGLVGSGACDSPPDDLREWRPEDHPAPPAATTTDRAAPPEAGSQGDAEARVVAALWTARCAGCHGRAGRGGGAEAPPGAAMPDFTNPAYHQSRSDNALALVVLKGKGMMPAFEGELTARQIASLVRHVRGFASDAE